MLTVTLHTVRVHHGGFNCHCTLQYDGQPSPNGRRDGRILYLSRGYHCECGESLHDGDKISIAHDEVGRLVHINCVERVAPL